MSFQDYPGELLEGRYLQPLEGSRVLAALSVSPDWQPNYQELEKFGTGRCEPPDYAHVSQAPIQDLLAEEEVKAELVLPLGPATLEQYNQGREGACVGYGASRTMTSANQKVYAARWLYLMAQRYDPWPGESYSGTTVRAAMKVLQTLGHVVADTGQVSKGRPSLIEGIESVRWATTVDQMRQALAQLKLGITIGVNWYQAFRQPRRDEQGRFWVGRGGELGRRTGGHCVSVLGALDSLEAFVFCNSWGRAFPWPCLIPYDVMDRLLREGGEAAIITDRVEHSPAPSPTNGGGGQVTPVEPSRPAPPSSEREIITLASSKLSVVVDGLREVIQVLGQAGASAPSSHDWQEGPLEAAGREPMGALLSEQWEG